MRVEFEGSKKLETKLKQALKKFPREREHFLRMEAEVLMSRVKPLTPVDTGQLRSGWQRTEPTGDAIDVYNNTEYAWYVEGGHRIRHSDKVVEGVFMLRDALDETLTQFPSDAKILVTKIFK